MTTTNTTIALSPEDLDKLEALSEQDNNLVIPSRTIIALIAQARAAQPAAVGAELPPLPKPAGVIYPGNYWTASEQAAPRGTGIAAIYTTQQVEQIRRAAVAADRAAQQQQAGAAASDNSLRRQIIQDTNDTLREQASTMLIQRKKIQAHEATIADLRAQLARQGQGAIYTCKNKGGAYELLGVATGAGKTKLVEPLTIYRDTASGALYFRAADDFAERMERTSAAQASAAQADEARDSQYVARLKKERDGWMEEAEARAAANAKLRQDLDLREMHQKKDVWFWQGDGTDYPGSMSNSMAVVIRADQLKAILASAASPTVPAQPAGLEYRTCCDHPDCTNCAGHGGFYRMTAQPVAAAADAGDVVFRNDGQEPDWEAHGRAEQEAIDAARYRILREHVSPAAVRISMRSVPPKGQSCAERIDMLCDQLASTAPATSAAAQPVAKVGESAAAARLANGYQGSTMMPDLHGPKITLRYATSAQADAAHAVICNMIDAAKQSTTTGATDGAEGQQ